MKLIHFTIIGQTYINALRLANVCAAKTDVRYYLNGVCFDTPNDDGTTFVVGTDSGILAKSPIELQHGENLLPKFIVNIAGAIPKTTLRAEFAIPDDYTSGTVIFSKQSGAPVKTAVVTRINGTYPNYQSMMDNKLTKGEKDSIGFNPVLVANAIQAVMPGYRTTSNKDFNPLPLVRIDHSNSDNDAMRIYLPPAPESTVIMMPARV